ncbi:hypothetical protein [Flavobacterium sp. RS13.1]|uniref:hypothetical protein n=1 Tax=Flavobacterium sp. RS13.1 TaxID=3400345 RepID=UPI003AAA65F3
MKRILFYLFLFISLVSKAQISSYFHGNVKDFIDLKTRPLIVELLEEDEKILNKLSKPKKAEELQSYKKMVRLYNEEITLYAKKYWTINKNIEFKNKSEVEILRKANNKSYAVLRNLRLNDIDFDFKSNLYLNVIVYTKIESNPQKPDSQVYLPISSKKTDVFLEEADYKYSLNILQDNINYIIAQNKSVNSENYVKEMAKGNCPLIKNKTLLVKESILYEKTKKEDCIKKYDGALNIVSDDEINRAFVEKDKDKVVLFSVPYEIGKGQMGPIGQSFLMSYKVVVDCETGKILYLFMPRGFAVMGQNISSIMIEKDFENIKNCK